MSVAITLPVAAVVAQAAMFRQKHVVQFSTACSNASLVSCNSHARPTATKNNTQDCSCSISRTHICCWGCCCCAVRAGHLWPNLARVLHLHRYVLANQLLAQKLPGIQAIRLRRTVTPTCTRCTHAAGAAPQQQQCSSHMGIKSQTAAKRGVKTNCWALCRLKAQPADDACGKVCTQLIAAVPFCCTSHKCMHMYRCAWRTSAVLC